MTVTNNEISDEQGSNRLFTRDFILLCLARLAFFCSMAFMLAVFPLYVLKIGGDKSDIGIVIGAFTIPIVILSPFAGRAADEMGRKWLMIAGTIIFVVSAILYNFAVSLILLIILRIFHGSGLGLFNTASSAYVADIAPIERRGEAMGYFGMVTNLAMAIAPALGVVIVEKYDFTVLFLISAATAFAAVALTSLLTDNYRPVARITGQPRAPLFHKASFFPSVIMASLSVTWGAVVSFFILFAMDRHIPNPGYFFTAYAIVLIASRTIAGILSDKLGREAVIIPGLVMTGIGIWVLCLADSMTMLMVVALIYGIGFGSATPTLMAFTIDRIGNEGRGAAMGTLGASFDVGVAVGSVILGFVLQYTDFVVTFLIAGTAPILAMIGFVIVGKRKGNENLS
ncbi:MAG: MFS transporter [Deltaproteobacteria bacterium]|nr:MFS transporter [Deltaproteobacteria bacterium]